MFYLVVNDGVERVLRGAYATNGAANQATRPAVESRAPTKVTVTARDGASGSAIGGCVGLARSTSALIDAGMPWLARWVMWVRLVTSSLFLSRSTYVFRLAF